MTETKLARAAARASTLRRRLAAMLVLERIREEWQRSRGLPVEPLKPITAVELQRRMKGPKE